MIDLKWTELSFGISLIFNILLFAFVFLFYGKYVSHPNWNKYKANIGLVLLALCLIIVATPLNSTDWFHYQEAVWRRADNFEPFYVFIINLFNGNYLMFRLIVWGLAFLFSCFTFRRLGLNVNEAIFFLIAVYLMTFNYARATLGMSSYFLGLSLMIKPVKGRKVFSFVLMLILFFGAYQFHHSLLPVILLSVTALIPLEKPLLIIPALLILPLLASVIVDNGFFLDQFSVDENILHKFNIYEQRVDEGRVSMWGVIRLVLDYGRFLIPIVVITVLVTIKKKILDVNIIRVFRVMMAIFLFAASFLFMNFNSYVFSYRYLYMTFIPITIISVYLYKHKIMNRGLYSFIIMWGIASHAFYYLYGLHTCMK